MARTKKVTAPEAQEVVSEVATEETFGSFIAPEEEPTPLEAATQPVPEEEIPEEVVLEAEEAPETAESAPVTADTPKDAQPEPAAIEPAESPAEAPEAPTGEEPEKPEEDDGKTHITMSLPSAPFTPDAIERLKAIVASKESLLKKALDADSLDIVVEEDRISFPWFTDHGWDNEVDAYGKLICALSKMALTQKRVSTTERQQNPDEKLAMRLFLIRLNFIGDEYKSARAILTRNFQTGGSRKSGEPIPEIDFGTPEVTRK